MTDDCTRNGGRLLQGQVQRLSVASQFVTMVMGVFAPWSSGGDPAAWYPEEAWNQADPGGAVPLRQASLGSLGVGDRPCRPFPIGARISYGPSLSPTVSACE